MSTDEPLLAVSGICKSFADGETERKVLENVCLQLQPGEILALWGPSGSGKSTLLNILAGVLMADAGSVTLNARSGDRFDYGTQPATATQRLRREAVGYVFQFFNLVPTLTVAENIELSLRLAHGKVPAALRQAAIERAGALGLTPLLDAFPDRLSGGESQRAAIARALAHEPSLLLADEPTGNLDAVNAERVMGAFVEQLASVGGALVIATHDEGVARRANRVFDLAQ